MHTHSTIQYDFLASENFIKNHVNRHSSLLIYDTNVFDNNFNLLNMLTNFNSSVEFAICSRIPLGEGWYDIESSPLTCNLLTHLVGDFSGGYSQTDYNFNFNINVKVTVDIYVNSSINFSVSHIPKYLLAFRIMKLESTSKITAQFETIPQCLLFFSLFFYICLRNKHDMRLRYFLIAFLYFYSLTGLSSP